MSLSNIFETTTLNWLFTATSVTRPTAWYIALYTVAPTDGGGGTEISGNAYVREAAAMSVTGDNATNTGAIEWPTASGTWGTIVAVGVFDALSAGNLIAYGNLTVSKTITSGDVFRIPAGDLDITMD
tara:strand:- start:149 stop:529 length:381 start_codon:yes stop_codon:yes gene_type:complete